MTVIPAAPQTFAGPSETDGEGGYDATFVRMDDPVSKTWDDGKTTLTAVCHWQFDEYPGEDIWTRINVMSRGPKSAFDKLSRALTGQPVGYGEVDTRAWENKRCTVMYGYGANPNKPEQFGVTGYTPIRKKRQAPATAQPAQAAIGLSDDTDETPF